MNVASGGVGLDVADRLEAVLADFGVDFRITVASGAEVVTALRAAVEASPDLVVTLGGDGTARLAAELCGPDGPLVAPLSGGTVNFLSRAIYGGVAWDEALIAALTEGEARPVAGGRVAGRPFYAAALLGTAALLAPAREAVRAGKLKMAWRRANTVCKRMFTSQIRFQTDNSLPSKAMALGLLSPHVSQACHGGIALEAVGLDFHGATEGFRLGLHALMGDWRSDPAVTATLCRHGRAWAKAPIPCILDGETFLLERTVEIEFEPNGFHALAPAR